MNNAFENDLCIQIVDSDSGVCRSLKSLFHGTGVKVFCYASAEEFLNKGALRRGCAIVELSLGGMGGIALQQELIKLGSAITVVFLSADGDVRQAVMAMRLGAADFITKPFAPEPLKTRIMALIGAEQDADIGRRSEARRNALVNTLTLREEQVLGLIAAGWRTKRVAEVLDISPRTVETHRCHIMQKLCAESVPDVVRAWVAGKRKGCIPFELS